MGATQSEIRLGRLIDERELTRAKHESFLAELESRENKNPSETERASLTLWREKAVELDGEIKDLAAEVQRHNEGLENSRMLRRMLAEGADGVDVNDDGIVYRDFYTYARDEVLTRVASLGNQWATEDERTQMAQRLQMLKRTPANTLSSNIPGISVAQHISQIFQVINKTRPLVAAATRVELDRGTLTYPRVDTKPIVAVQSAEKTEAGNTGMAISLQTTTASTYLGGGDLSWQAVNWSTPNALQLWFDLAAADYALKTEQDAAQALQHSGFSNNINTGLLSGTPTFAEIMTAIGQGYSDVFTNSGRTADTVFMAPDRFGYLLGTTSTAQSMFVTVGGERIGPLNFVVSRGMDAGVIVVGDAQALIVAETPGAPVELRVVEPAIGGYEVGLIGAFEAVVADNGAFAMITTAS